MDSIQHRFMYKLLMLSGLALLLAACMESDPARDYDPAYPAPPYGTPYYQPAYPVGGYVVVPTPRNEVDAQIDHAHRSIQSGVESGKLTRDEAKELRGELKTIEREAAQMERDGRLNKSERETLRNDLNRVQSNIRREKDDDERRRRKNSGN